MKRFTPLAFFLFAGCATVAASPADERNGVLVDTRGMTLYIFKKDSPNASTCYDGCAKAWPPYMAQPGAAPSGDFTLVTRRDGGKQWAYKTMPLYFYAGDSAAGETSGDGSGNVWYSVRDAGGAKAAVPKTPTGYGY